MPVEWDTPFQIVSAAGGALDLNAVIGDRYLLDLSNCDSSLDKRVTTDNIPQGDGNILHKDFTGGYQVNLAMSLWLGDCGDGQAGPACAGDLVRMFDLLALHLRSLYESPGRLLWTPTGYAQRMADQVKLIAGPNKQASPRGSGGTQITFTLLSPFPYALTAAETDTTIADGDTDPLENGGNTDFFPVVRVAGPTDAFTITNNSVLDENGDALQLVYDADRPGAVSIPDGDYGEFDFFKNTAYLHGDGHNLKAGIDIEASDFFPLAPGENDITMDGAAALFLYNDAWWD